MADTDHYIFFYPHPDDPREDVARAAGPVYVKDLWEQVYSCFADHIGAAKITLYAPPELSVVPYATLLSRSRDWLKQHHDEMDKVVPRIQRVSTVFPDGPSPDMVHLLVVTEVILESLNELGTLQEKVLKERETRTEWTRDVLPKPSDGVSSSTGVHRVVDDHADKFHAGRPAGNYGPPVSLFNDALGRLDHRLRHLDDVPIDPPPALIRLVHSLTVVAANSYPSEDRRVEATEPLLSQILNNALRWKPSKHRYGIEPDAISEGHPPFLVVVEVKNEAGLHGDASLQAGLSYAHLVTAPDFKALRKQSNCPAILCGIMGNLLEIGVAMYTDGTYHDLLLSERLHLGFHSAQNILRLSQAFAATRDAISELQVFYTRLNVHPPPRDSIAFLFPSPRPLPSYTDFVPSLVFTHRLRRSGDPVLVANSESARQSRVYLATMSRKPPSAGEALSASSPSDDGPTNSIEVVVKFTDRYHADAHKLLAAEHLAPALHACVPVCGDLFMAVMDRVEGEMAWAVLARGEQLPYRIYEDVRRAITLLHSHNLVFGDLRTPNIMVVPGGSGPDDGPRGMLVDLDWVGAHGGDRYPASLDESLPDWTIGIQRHGIMDKAHDTAMLVRFKEKCHSA
ncbi:hypothetical protein BD414DRAFT_423507 [Trametes punicea]|nr:hypothetical protein BD414DRAFT_423507 [Trametes punicea]